MNNAFVLKISFGLPVNKVKQKAKISDCAGVSAWLLLVLLLELIDWFCCNGELAKLPVIQENHFRIS